MIEVAIAEFKVNKRGWCVSLVLRPQERLPDLILLDDMITRLQDKSPDTIPPVDSVPLFQMDPHIHAIPHLINHDQDHAHGADNLMRNCIGMENRQVSGIVSSEGLRNSHDVARNGDMA